MFLQYPQSIVDKLTEDELHDLDLLVEDAIHGEFDAGYDAGYEDAIQMQDQQ
jgi:hypothetical protein